MNREPKYVLVYAVFRECQVDRKSLHQEGFVLLREKLLGKTKEVLLKNYLRSVVDMHHHFLGLLLSQRLWEVRLRQKLINAPIYILYFVSRVLLLVVFLLLLTLGKGNIQLPACLPSIISDSNML